jgi:hypothetical protein
MIWFRLIALAMLIAGVVLIARAETIHHRQELLKTLYYWSEDS